MPIGMPIGQGATTGEGHGMVPSAPATLVPGSTVAGRCPILPQIAPRSQLNDGARYLLLERKAALREPLPASIHLLHPQGAPVVTPA